MKLTNKLGLPQPIVDAVKNDGYSSGDADYSVTTLLKPPRIKALERIHKDELEEDVSDRIFSLLGQVMHGILERAETEAVAERRLSIVVSGKKISGQMDRSEAKHDSLLYNGAVLQDYKLTTIYKVRDGLDPEFEKQLNMYAAILRENGRPVEKAEIVAILRDWSKGAAKREGEGYPQQQVVVQNVPLWPHEKAMQFIAERVALHEAAKVELPECTPEERWAEPEKWATMKKGGKRAVKLHDTYDQAMGLAKALTDKTETAHSVEHRPGVNRRCEGGYCPASRFCEQFKKLQAQKKGNT